MESIKGFSHSFVGYRILNILVLSPCLSRPTNGRHILYQSLLHVNATTYWLYLIIEAFAFIYRVHNHILKQGYYWLTFCIYTQSVVFENNICYLFHETYENDNIFQNVWHELKILNVCLCNRHSLQFSLLSQTLYFNLKPSLAESLPNV